MTHDLLSDTLALYADINFIIVSVWLPTSANNKRMVHHTCHHSYCLRSTNTFSLVTVFLLSLVSLLVSLLLSQFSRLTSRLTSRLKSWLALHITLPLVSRVWYFRHHVSVVTPVTMLSPLCHNFCHVDIALSMFHTSLHLFLLFNA